MRMNAVLRKTMALAVCAAALGACADTMAPTPSRIVRRTAPAAGEGEWRALRAVVHAAAKALDDPVLRMRVGRDIGRSPVREFKLEFDRYVRTPAGSALLDRMALAAGVTRPAMEQLLASVRPLELYMPLARHRRLWTPDDRVFVAGMLDDNAMVGFDLDGGEVPLSVTQPPDTPTLVLVPVETDFARDLRPSIGRPTTRTTALDCDPETAIIPCEEPDEGGGLGPYPNGIYVDSIVVRDHHEPWGRGSPELDMLFSGTLTGDWMPTSQFYNLPPNAVAPITTFAWDSTVTRLVFADCAGESGAGFRNFQAESPIILNYYHALIAEDSNFAIVEDVYHPTHLIQIGKRLRPAGPPFVAELVERDDGAQCPEPPSTTTINAAIYVEFRHMPWKDRLQQYAGNIRDFFLGGNNDLVATFTFTSFSELEGLNHSFRAGADADVWFTQHGFNHANIPPAQNPWNGQ